MWVGLTQSAEDPSRREPGFWREKVPPEGSMLWAVLESPISHMAALGVCDPGWALPEFAGLPCEWETCQSSRKIHVIKKTIHKVFFIKKNLPLRSSFHKYLKTRNYLKTHLCVHVCLCVSVYVSLFFSVCVEVYFLIFVCSKGKVTEGGREERKT